MRFKSRAFALIWIMLSLAIFFGVTNQKSPNANTLKNTGIIKNTTIPISQDKLMILAVLATLMSISTGVFFCLYSDELQNDLENCKRTYKLL